MRLIDNLGGTHRWIDGCCTLWKMELVIAYLMSQKALFIPRPCSKNMPRYIRGKVRWINQSPRFSLYLQRFRRPKINVRSTFFLDCQSSARVSTIDNPDFLMSIRKIYLLCISWWSDPKWDSFASCYFIVLWLLYFWSFDSCCFRFCILFNLSCQMIFSKQ